MYFHFALKFYDLSFILDLFLKVLYSSLVNHNFSRQHYETMASYDDRKRSDVTVQNSGRLTSIEGSSADKSQQKGIYY